MIVAHAIRSTQIVYDRLFAGSATHADGKQFDLAGTNEEGVEAALPQIMNPDRYAPELRDYVLVAADAVVTQLHGPAVSAEIYHVILKPAKGGAATPWHQDEAYWDPTLQYHSVSIWLPLQEATPENGSMSFDRAVTSEKCSNIRVLVATHGFAVLSS